MEEIIYLGQVKYEAKGASAPFAEPEAALVRHRAGPAPWRGEVRAAQARGRAIERTRSIAEA